MLTAEDRKALIEMSEAHRKADEFEQGDGYSCSIGCSVRDLQKLGRVDASLNPYSHKTVSELWGVPLHIARLFDAIFEGLPKSQAVKWTTRWQRVLREGGDYSLVWPKLAVWLLTDEEHGVRRFVLGDESKRQREAVDHVAQLWQRVINGESVESLREEFNAAADAAARAAVAAAVAADAAVAAVAADAAYAAANAAVAADAADAAVAAYAADADRNRFWRAISDKLIELLQAC